MRTRYMRRVAPDTRAQFSPYWGDAAPVAGMAVTGSGASAYGCPACAAIAAIAGVAVEAGVGIYATERSRATTLKLAEDQRKEAEKQEKRLADEAEKQRKDAERAERRAFKEQERMAAAGASGASAAPAVSPVLLGAVGLGLLYLLTQK